MLKPGSTIGILGGGQLGRMLTLAAARLGFDAHIYTDVAESPAARVAAKATHASFADDAALAAFARDVDVVTTEFENVPARTAEALIAAGVQVRPGALALATAQDRILEKRFFESLGVDTVRFAEVGAEAELAAALRTIGAPAILKARRMGYDGKGQARITHTDQAGAAWARIGGAPAILEAMAPFQYEISVVAARSADGAFAAYEPGRNVHEDGILRRTILPAGAPPATRAEAERATRKIAEALDFVGVLCVEFFVLEGGALLANEMAPRVHNSGHWTEAAGATSQFEQNIRAVADWPLGPVTRLFDATMENLIGEEVESWPALVADPAVHLHLYGKRETRPGRKMGHYTRLAPLGSGPG
jgi:5-(carboxyamino)imidazole ribonucleotide synthase